MTEQLLQYAEQWRDRLEKIEQNIAVLYVTTFLAGAAMCLISWRRDAAPLLAALLPVFMVMCQSRLQAWLLGLGYGLAIGLMGFGGAGEFFGGSALLGLAAGGAYGLIFSASVVALYPKNTKSPKKKAVAIVAWTVLWAYPPVGAFLPGSLIATWGFWFPGTKWAGLALGLGLTALLGAYAHTYRGRLAVAAVVLLALVLSPMQDRLFDRVGDWTAVSTSWGVQTPETVPETLVKMREMVDRAAKKGAKVVVFPESIIGTYDQSEQGALDIMIGQAAQQNKVDVIFGSNELTDQGMANQAQAYEYTPEGLHQWAIQARQTVPVAEWNPLSKYHYPADWFARGVTPVNGRSALFLFCYEEYLPWEVLYSIGREKPEMIVGLANLWWTRGTGEPVLQHRYAEGYARLFKLPLLVSMNTWTRLAQDDRN